MRTPRFVWIVKYFRNYLVDKKFNFISGHRHLICLFPMKDPGSRLSRWCLKLEKYNYKIERKPGQ